jgi:hypothetical protein
MTSNLDNNLALKKASKKMTKCGEVKSTIGIIKYTCLSKNISDQYCSSC